MSRYETDRLLLRRWREEDLAPFAAMNADPRVMEHFPTVLTLEESHALMDRIEAGFEQYGFGLWACEHKASRGMIGFVGLSVPGFTTSFTPCVEIGWRIAHAFWGQGLAPEAARLALDVGFYVHGLQEIVSFTAVQNMRSRRVMEKIGMSHDPEEDFDHPVLDVHHPLCRHVLYRIASPYRNVAQNPS